MIKIKMIKILKSIARAALVILCGLTFGVLLLQIMSNLDKQWAIVSLVCFLIGIVAFIDYKIDN
jgi:uncharacterized membrane protein YccC